MRDNKGFSLIELLVVMAIILIVASIAIPYLMRSRMTANESSAVASLRTIVTAELSYALTYPDTGYATTLDALGPAVDKPTSDAAGLIDKTLVSRHKSGYDFTLTADKDGFKIQADPTERSLTGFRSFCADQNAVIYASDSDTCSTNPLEGTPIN